MKNSEVIVFTDGSSRGNPGSGGWGAVIVDDDHVQELGGAEKETTNNKMELTAAIRALEKTSEDTVIKLHTDSSYVINGITKWVKGWKRNGWKTQTKDDVVNRDLWEELHRLSEKRSIKWQYVGGHVGIVGNERCDHIATDFADGMKVNLFNGKLSDYDLPNILDISYDEEAVKAKKSSSSRSNAKAYSYVSMVKGVIETHATWAECEKRVKGAKGAKYKKALSESEENEIVKEFGTFVI